jgi:S1-C subfamily serine protease
LGLLLLFTVTAAPRSKPSVTASADTAQDNLVQSVARLSSDVEQIREEQASAKLVLSRYRNSICYIQALYTLRTRGGRPHQTRISGTGFVVAPGLVATNRHVAEPWFDDPEAEELIAHGAQPKVEKLVAFFPGLESPVEMINVQTAPEADLAILRLSATRETEQLAPLPLAEAPGTPGDSVVVVGYPMGVAGMVAKSPWRVYRKLAYSGENLNTARTLASLSLIRPSSTSGHLGDVVGEKLIYDAPTAHGGSGGPVFNSHGLVIGVNSAYISGFAGGALGVSVTALRPLVEAAQAQR